MNLNTGREVVGSSNQDNQFKRHVLTNGGNSFLTMHPATVEAAKAKCVTMANSLKCFNTNTLCHGR